MTVLFSEGKIFLKDTIVFSGLKTVYVDEQCQTVSTHSCVRVLVSV